MLKIQNYTLVDSGIHVERLTYDDIIDQLKLERVFDDLLCVCLDDAIYTFTNNQINEYPLEKVMGSELVPDVNLKEALRLIPTLKEKHSYFQLTKKGRDPIDVNNYCSGYLMHTEVFNINDDIVITQVYDAESE